MNKIIENKKVAIGYCRVSTDDQADNGLSLGYQEEQCKKAALADNYKDEQIIIIRDEGRSGTSISGRPGMKEILRMAENKEISILYVTHSDRLARNVVDDALIRGVLYKNGITIKYLNGQSSGNDASSNITNNMFAAFNQYHADNTREKTKQATDLKARAGYFPTHAPVGYSNVPNPDPNYEKVAKRIIVPNPKMAPLVTEAFKLYATGRYNGYELNDLMYEKGLVANISGRKLSSSMFYDMLKNRIYLGEIHWQDIHVKEGKHQPLIDEETFNKVQKITFGKAGNRCRRRKYFWLLNGYIFCPIHNRRYTAEWHLDKGRAYYHCPHRGCGKFIEKSDLENQVAERIKGLEFSKNFIDEIFGEVKKTFTERRRDYDKNQRTLNNQKNAWEAKLRVAEERLLDQTIRPERYKEMENEFNSEINKIDEKLNKLKKEREIHIERANEILSFTKDIYGTYIEAPERLQKRLIDLFFDGLDVVDGVIIKERYRQLFKELMIANDIIQNNPYQEKTFGNKVKSKVIINTNLGRFSSIILPILQDEEYISELYEKYLHIKEELINVS